MPRKASLVAEDPKGMCHVSDLTVIDLSSPKIRAGAAECPQLPASSVLPSAQWSGGTLTTSAAWDPAETERCFATFAAFAAHELRGEITLQLALAEATLADPTADTAALRAMGNGVVAACERQERLLEALLTLTRTEYGQLRREPVDLAASAAEALRAHDHRELRSSAALERARTTATHCSSSASSRTLLRRHPSQHPRRPARRRHVHRSRPRQLHDRERRTRDPERRADPPLPTLPATQLSRRLLCRRGRARARDRARDRPRPRRHRQRRSPNRRRTENRDRLSGRCVSETERRVEHAWAL